MDGRFIIDNLLRQEKNERLDFLPKATEDMLAKTITAMLNNRGGDIVIGVDDNKRILGVSEGDMSGLSKALANRIRPSAPIDIHSIDYNGTNILLISVWEGAQKPYHCDGKIYQKLGDEIVVASPESIGNMLLERKQSDFNWERMPVLGAEVDDLDMDEVRNTMKEYIRTSGNNIDDEELFLIKNGLLKDGNLTNACIALYAKTPAQFIAQTRIKLSVFSSDSNADLVEARLFEGNIFKNISAIFQFIDMTYSKSVKVDGLYRTEKWNYPRIAVREGIMNAIVHRDYNAVNGFMSILIYPNRMEIICYGKPLINLTGNFMSAGYSVLRNPDIAHHCYYRHLIEMMGTGIPRMIQDSKTNGFDIPEFIVANDIVKVTFPNIVHLREENRNTDDLRPYFEGIIEGTIEGIRNDVKSKLVTILCLLHERSGLRANVIGEQTHIPVKSIERYVNLLKKAGLLYYSGAKNTGGYYLSDHILRE